eukprot:7253084-Prymnesium_polylepis.1
MGRRATSRAVRKIHFRNSHRYSGTRAEFILLLAKTAKQPFHAIIIIEASVHCFLPGPCTHMLTRIRKSHSYYFACGLDVFGAKGGGSGSGGTIPR